MKGINWMIPGLFVCFGVAVWVGLIVPVLFEYMPASFAIIIGFGIPSVILMSGIASLVSRSEKDRNGTPPCQQESSGFHDTASISSGEHVNEDIEPSGFTMTESLSKRESEVLDLLSTGKTNKEIARTLFVEVGTIKTHTNSIYRKLGARHRAEAIAKAREFNIL